MRTSPGPGSQLDALIAAPLMSVSSKKPGLAVVPPIDDASEHAADDACPKCFGSGMEIVPGKGARPCSCRDRRESNPFEKVRVPKRYLGCHFNSYTPDAAHPSQKEAQKFAMQFAGEYPAVDRGHRTRGAAPALG